MNTNFEIDLSVINGIYYDTFIENIPKLFEEIDDRFRNGTTYKELSSSTMLNFSGYINGKLNSLLDLPVKGKNLGNFLKEVLDNHVGIDAILREEQGGMITDNNAFLTLSNLKKISEFDNEYDPVSNHPLIEFDTVFTPPLSGEGYNFTESESVINFNYDVMLKKEDYYIENEKQLFETESESVLNNLGGDLL